MKTLYLDIFSGIAGDMFIAALLDLGVDAVKLERELKKLKLDGYHLHISHWQKSAIAGVKFDVHLSPTHMTMRTRTRARIMPTRIVITTGIITTSYRMRMPTRTNTTTNMRMRRLVGKSSGILPRSNSSSHAASFRRG